MTTVAIRTLVFSRRIYNWHPCKFHCHNHELVFCREFFYWFCVQKIIVCAENRSKYSIRDSESSSHFCMVFAPLYTRPKTSLFFTACSDVRKNIPPPPNAIGLIPELYTNFQFLFEFWNLSLQVVVEDCHFTLGVVAGFEIRCLPVLSRLLKGDDLAVRTASGEAIALLYEVTNFLSSTAGAADDDDDGDSEDTGAVKESVRTSSEKPASSKSAMSVVGKALEAQEAHVMEQMKSLSVHAGGKGQPRKERAMQRSAFRELLATIEVRNQLLMNQPTISIYKRGKKNAFFQVKSHGEGIHILVWKN